MYTSVIRIDATKTGLQRPYTGPHEVLSKTNKTFRIRFGKRQVVVSRDRIKPAFTDDALLTLSLPPPSQPLPPDWLHQPAHDLDPKDLQHGTVT